MIWLTWVTDILIFTREDKTVCLLQTHRDLSTTLSFWFFLTFWWDHRAHLPKILNILNVNLPTVCRKCTSAPSKMTKLILECSFFTDEGLVLKNSGLEMPASKFAQLIGDLKRWTPVFRGYTPPLSIVSPEGMGERTSGQTGSFGERSRRWYLISLPQNLKGSWTVRG